MSTNADEIIRSEVRRQTVRRIEAERERYPWSSYAALADGVIQYLNILERERRLRWDGGASDGEKMLRAIVGWPEG